MSDARPIGVGWRPLGAIEASAGGTVASGHEATARNLFDRGVTIGRRRVLEQPPNLRACHDAFWKALSSGTNRRVPYENYSEMASALDRSYPKGKGKNDGETAFDENLFEKFRNYLRDMVAEVITKKRADGASSLAIIVLKDEWVIGGATYAMGFSRQVTSEQLGIPKEFGCAKSSRHDHSCVLLKKRTDGVFSVIETSANIELKTEPNSCRLEEEVGLEPRKLKKPDLVGKDGALAQSIAYTLSEVWPCLARRGMKTDVAETQSNVPFGLLACRLKEMKKTKQKSATSAKKMKRSLNETRWAVGNLAIPNICGGRFQYQINSFGSFESSASSQALAAYLSVMTDGIKFLQSLRTRQSFTPYSLSGQQLRFGAQPLHLSYYKSPFTVGKWGAPISQGEFWNGTMSREELSTLTTDFNDDDDFVVFNDDLSTEGDLSVMVKVSSRAVFNSLISPQIAFKALKKYKRHLAAQRQLERSKNSQVLIAVWNPFDEGLVAIMHDISTTHSDLRPGDLIENSSVSLCDLWRHFRTFVLEQLIPLASAGIIHPDIRAGYDWTANIMAKNDGSDMLLVDFESLVPARSYAFSGSDKHRRYFDVPEEGNAFSFVCLQCIVIAVAWSQQHKQVEADKMKQPMVVSEFVDLNNLALETPGVVEILLGEIGSQFGEAGFTNLDKDRIRSSLEQ